MHEDVAMQPSFFAIASTILRITHFFSSRPRRSVFVPIITIVAQHSKTTKTSYPLDRNFGIPGPFGHGNRLPTCKYLAMQPQLCGDGLGAL